MGADDGEGIPSPAEVQREDTEVRVGEQPAQAEAGERRGGQGAAVGRAVASVIEDHARASCATINGKRGPDCGESAVGVAQACAAANEDGIVAATGIERNRDREAAKVDRIGATTEIDRNALKRRISDSGSEAQAGDGRRRQRQGVIQRVETVIKIERIEISTAVEGDRTGDSVQRARRGVGRGGVEVKGVVARTAVEHERAAVGPHIERIGAAVAIHRDIHAAEAAIEREGIVARTEGELGTLDAEEGEPAHERATTQRDGVRQSEAEQLADGSLVHEALGLGLQVEISDDFVHGLHRSHEIVRGGAEIDNQAIVLGEDARIVATDEFHRRLDGSEIGGGGRGGVRSAGIGGPVIRFDTVQHAIELGDFLEAIGNGRRIDRIFRRIHPNRCPSGNVRRARNDDLVGRHPIPPPSDTQPTHRLPVSGDIDDDGLRCRPNGIVMINIGRRIDDVGRRVIHVIRSLAANVNRVVTRAALDFQRQTVAENPECVVAADAEDHDTLDVDEVDLPAAAEDLRVGDDEDVVRLGAFENDAVKAGAAIDLERAVLNVANDIRAVAAVDRRKRGAFLQERLDPEQVVAVVTEQPELGLVVVDLKRVVAAAAIDFEFGEITVGQPAASRVDHGDVRRGRLALGCDNASNGKGVVTIITIDGSGVPDLVDGERIPARPTMHVELVHPGVIDRLKVSGPGGPDIDHPIAHQEQVVTRCAVDGETFRVGHAHTGVRDVDRVDPAAPDVDVEDVVMLATIEPEGRGQKIRDGEGVGRGPAGEADVLEGGEGKVLELTPGGQRPTVEGKVAIHRLDQRVEATGVRERVDARTAGHDVVARATIDGVIKV